MAASSRRGICGCRSPRDGHQKRPLGGPHDFLKIKCCSVLGWPASALAVWPRQERRGHTLELRGIADAGRYFLVLNKTVGEAALDRFLAAHPRFFRHPL